mmetsp:Transcript_150692/g.420039  ORF Transcript_150692/g.420039 Transcript_150692/m.420039 type:complete len:286 (+) Transcript_150692:19-876(+)
MDKKCARSLPGVSEVHRACIGNSFVPHHFAQSLVRRWSQLKNLRRDTNSIVKLDGWPPHETPKLRPLFHALQGPRRVEGRVLAHELLATLREPHRQDQVRVLAVPAHCLLHEVAPDRQPLVVFEAMEQDLQLVALPAHDLPRVAHGRGTHQRLTLSLDGHFPTRFKLHMHEVELRPIVILVLVAIIPRVILVLPNRSGGSDHRHSRASSYAKRLKGLLRLAGGKQNISMQKLLLCNRHPRVFLDALRQRKQRRVAGKVLHAQLIATQPTNCEVEASAACHGEQCA